METVEIHLRQDRQAGGKVNHPVRLFLPERYHETWDGILPPRKMEVHDLASGYSLSDLKALLPNTEIEVGGSMGPTWYEVHRGSRHDCRYTDGLFTWHTHAEEDVAFSLRDWMTFLSFDNVCSAVFAGRHCKVYTKTKNMDDYKSFVSRLSEHKTLSFIQFCSMLRRRFFLDDPLQADDRTLSSIFNVKSETMEFFT